MGTKLYRGEKLQVGIEYQMSSWNDLVQRAALGTEDTDRSHSPSRGNVSFHGLAVTALMRF